MLTANGDRLEALRDWLVRIGDDDWAWFAKRLSANDTGLTGSHQVGFYLPREFALTMAPDLGRRVPNPRLELRFLLMSHGQEADPNLIYYNSRVLRDQPNGRNEFRVTGFGGRRSALQDPEATGSILLTAWHADRRRVEAWLAVTVEEEESLEGILGPIEPGTVLVRTAAALGTRVALSQGPPATCEPDITDLPAAWAGVFPPGQALRDEAVRRRPGTGQPVDARIIDRYHCEFGIFKVVEQAHVLPLISAGFSSVDGFLSVAQTVANRRKARAGRSLELHLATIFDEERVEYESGKTTEGGRRPDFLFPTFAAYHAGRSTHMLGVKTSVKERWRQVLDEAERIPDKHLFTLSEGVSPQQFMQMKEARIHLVVPAVNISKFPSQVRAELLTLASFIELARKLGRQ
jgi:hypothetical protein